MDQQHINPQEVPSTRPRRRSRVIKSLTAKANARRSGAERFADWMTDFFGTVPFLVANAIWFVVWIIINLGLIPGVVPFDPFPFGLLTMIVSLEAIFLAIIVLISQNREAKVAEMREEIDLQINTLAEEEVTKIISMLATLLEKQGISVREDEDLQRMLKPLSSEELERHLAMQLHKK